MRQRRHDTGLNDPSTGKTASREPSSVGKRTLTEEVYGRGPAAPVQQPQAGPGRQSSSTSDPDGRVARVDGARVAVIEAGRSARRTRTPNARLHAVAGVLITARRAIRDGGVSHADGGVASVHGARIAVVGSGSRTGLALAPVVARRNAITEVTGVAQGAFRAIDVQNAGHRIARVARARIAIVDDRGNTRDAGAGGIAALSAIAGIAVRA